jgi:peptidoglycan/LPS O-acetylase OafA/YrhL
MVGLVLAIAAWFLPHFPVFIGAYGCGALFWLAGWGLSQVDREPRASPSVSLPWRILSPLLLLLAAFHFDAGRILLNGIGFRHDTDSGIVNISNLALFPACAACMLASTSRRIPAISWVKLTAAVIPVVCAVYLLAVNRLAENPRWVFAAVCAGAGLLTWNVSTRWIEAAGQWFGSISYGFYLCHFPLLFLVRSLPLPNGTPATFAFRAVLWAFLSVTTAWVLERQLQPFVVSRWRVSRPPALAPFET